MNSTDAHKGTTEAFPKASVHNRLSYTGRYGPTL